MNPVKNKRTLFWEKYIGNADEFSMENRAFNFISIISIPLLLLSIIIDLFNTPSATTLVCVVLIIAQSVVYYYSRYKKKYHALIAYFSIAGYIALIIYYYTNDGISGPVLFFFFITLNFLIAVSRPKHHLLWLSMHLVIVWGLLLSEYLHPEWVKHTYTGRPAQFIDIAWSYTVAITFIFFVTHYLRSYFRNEQFRSTKRAEEISTQNTQITAQNLELGKINEEKNKLFSIISHDLRSPLAAITGYLELLSQDLLTDSEKSEIGAQLQEQTKYTSDLLLNLLSWAKSQMQGINVDPVSVLLRDIVDEVINSKIAVAARKGIKLTYAINPAIEVVCDKEMLRIVLRNLVNNAIKFTLPGGEITIRASTKSYDAVISVKDTGIGMTDEAKEGIFTTGTRSTFGTNNEKGIGLGLIMCKQFMEYQNGSIWFESEVGKGSVFYITLPLTRA